MGEVLDRAFIRPVAHRGLHDAARGIIENSASAFRAAIEGGYAIECDLQPIAGGHPVVHHDQTLNRLTDGTGPLVAVETQALRELTYRGTSDRILRFPELLELVDGRVPLLVEVKSDWRAPVPQFLEAIAQHATAYKGPLALMSFDPAVMATLRELAPGIPRGIVSGVYRGTDWWAEILTQERRSRLSDLLESSHARPRFFAYHVDDLPTPVTRFIREGLGMPLFTWTVRRRDQWDIAARWADAPIFEGAVPQGVQLSPRPDLP